MDSQGDVLITGASTGIGKATALHLEQLGWRVFAGVRKAKDGDALCAQSAGRLVPILMDVTDARAIADAKSYVSRTVGDKGLQGLVNNAGVGFSLPLEFTPLDSLRELFEVNVFGLLGVTQAFLPLLRRARGRIVNVSSTASIVVAPFHVPYSASKFCVNALSDGLRRELAPLGVQVSVIQPGSIDTPIWRKGFEWSQEIRNTVDAEMDEVYGTAFSKMNEYFQGMAERGVTPELVARAIAQALTSKRAKRYYLVGSDAQRFGLMKRMIPERFHDAIVLREMGIQG